MRISLVSRQISQMNHSRYLTFVLLLFAGIASFLCLAGCEKNPPKFVPKVEYGKEAVIHHDQMADQPEFLRVRKNDREAIAKAIAARREMRDKARGVYKKQSIWDY